MQMQGTIVDMNKIETIELVLPLNPAYVSAARLTASSITNRLSFDIEKSEDIKSAVSEACIYIIRRKTGRGVTNFKIQFDIYEHKLEVSLTCDVGNAINDDVDEYGLIMIKAFMDEAEIIEDKQGIFSVRMMKAKK